MGRTQGCDLRLLRAPHVGALLVELLGHATPRPLRLLRRVGRQDGARRSRRRGCQICCCVGVHRADLRLLRLVLGQARLARRSQRRRLGLRRPPGRADSAQARCSLRFLAARAGGGGMLWRRGRLLRPQPQTLLHHRRAVFLWRRAVVVQGVHVADGLRRAPHLRVPFRPRLRTLLLPAASRRRRPGRAIGEAARGLAAAAGSSVGEDRRQPLTVLCVIRARVRSLHEKRARAARFTFARAARQHSGRGSESRAPAAERRFGV
mmetsp:Transcript_108881/g.314414  ORF Transcript_108881/g.314414 Transcript_108881/m.314414 type:complete len:263 (-) Transcript_108881:19-807(-)